MKRYEDTFDSEQEANLKRRQEEERDAADRRYNEAIGALLSFMKCIFFGFILIYMGVYPHTTGVLNTLPAYWWQAASFGCGILIGLGLALIFSGMARLLFGYRLFS